MLLRPVLMPILRNPLQGIADGIRNMLAELLGSSQFFAPLTHSLVLARGTGSPTFTRATTATFTDWEGVLRTVPSGCARFEGARMVWNLLGNTENLLGAGWAAVGGAPVQNVVAPDGTTTGWSKALASAGDEIRCHTTYNPAGRSGLGSVYLKGTGTVSIRLSNSVDQQFVTQFTLTSDWLRVPTSVNAANSTVGTWLMGIFRNTGDTATSVDVWHPQLEDVTGQADQTASEYVSVGVESAPYHGAGADGVEFFDTDRSGNPIPAATNLGYLAEGARTNLCLQSNAFTTTWTKVNAGDTVTSDSVVAPDGTTTADTLTGAAGNTQKGLTQGFSNFATGTPLTFSVYLKYSTQQFVQLITNTAGDGYANFDLVNGTTSFSTATSQIVAMSNGWYRCSITVTCSGATTNWYILFSNSLASTRYEATTSVGVLPLWGAQYETGSFASTYIPTTTAAVTRAADVLSYTGGDIPNLKTLCATFRREVGVSNLSTVVALSDGTVNEYAQAFLSNATQSGMSGGDGGAAQWSQLTSNAYTPGSLSTMAWSAATNDVKMAKDGVAQTADTVATMPTVTQLNVGHVAGAFQLNGTVRGVYGWTRNLSQSELGAITA